MAPTNDRTGGIPRVLIPLLAALAVVLAFVLPARLEAHDGNSGHGHSGQESDDFDREAHDDGDDGGTAGRKDRHGGAPPGSGPPQAVAQAPPPQVAPPAAAPTAVPPPARDRRRGRRPRPQRDGGRVHLPPARPPVSAPRSVAPGGGGPATLPGRPTDPSAGAPRRAAASEHPRTRRARGARRHVARPAAPTPAPAPTARRRGPRAAVGLALAEPTSSRPVAGVEPLLLAVAGAGLLLAAVMLRPGRRGRAR